MLITPKIKLVQNSLNKEGISDKQLYAIVDGFSVEEWAFVLASKNDDPSFYNKVIPFYAYCFKSNQTKAMISSNLATKMDVGDGLADALHIILNNGSLDKNEQPSFENIYNKPILLNLFGGGILSHISSAGFSDDVSIYFRGKFKKCLNDFHNEVSLSDDPKLSAPLALTGNNKVCSPLDFDQTEVTNTLKFIYFLQAMNTVVNVLNIEQQTEEITEKIEALRFFDIIKETSATKKEEKSNLKLLNSSLSYIEGAITNNDSYDDIISRLDPIMLSDLETDILKSMIAACGVAELTEHTNCDINEEPLLFDSIDSESEDHQSSPSLFNKLKDTLNKHHHELVDENSVEKKTPTENDLTSNVTIDGVLIKTKKRGVKPFFLIAVIIATLTSGYFIAGKTTHKINEHSTVIGNAQGGEQHSNYPVIKVTSH